MAGLDPPAWSPPVFYKVLEGSIGFTAGGAGSADTFLQRACTAAVLRIELPGLACICTSIRSPGAMMLQAST